ncbi:hypothetical protein K493DRAFT_362932 [Basidiobolus meristosporus CBS 931.73]|uniref:3D domain-containing protein n=1 Tax=Basidiobolus meristosporus CBS 931.73 TaxID=1314790 RepID=A0A1Y1WY27_9FUNG|nr:hypothetical protein K493DRAFT_362932 [Basidiobolus meristosporus CBS 931.73]|eukprot:ORX78467.1 hypothetical protein K493DRAFT_362932 [Basidiobolus meristosporus CBS 931.73]
MARRVKMTYYWVAKESEHSGSKNVAIKTCCGKTIAMVSKSFANAARMEGTARLSSGKMINLRCSCGGGYSCFMEPDSKWYPFGLGTRSNALRPFISISANDLPYGSNVTVDQLKGLKMANRVTHNGRVRVDDKGWSFGSNHIDLLVGEKRYYEYISRNFGTQLKYVDIWISCKLQR